MKTSTKTDYTCNYINKSIERIFYYALTVINFIFLINIFNCFIYIVQYPSPLHITLHFNYLLRKCWCFLTQIAHKAFSCMCSIGKLYILTHCNFVFYFKTLKDNIVFGIHHTIKSLLNKWSQFWIKIWTSKDGFIINDFLDSGLRLLKLLHQEF